MQHETKPGWITPLLVTAGLLLWSVPATATAPWGATVTITYEDGSASVNTWGNIDCDPLQTSGGDPGDPTIYRVECTPDDPTDSGAERACHAPGTSVWIAPNATASDDRSDNGTEDDSGDNETQEDSDGNQTSSGSSESPIQTPLDWPEGTVTGTTRCGAAEASCTALSPGSPSCHDAEHDVDEDPPLVCLAEVHAGSDIQEWSVRCYPSDPPLIPVV